VTGGDTHKQISEEVHHISEHTCPFVIIFPYRADRSCEIGNKRNHREDKEHRNNCYPVTFFGCISFHLREIRILSLLIKELKFSHIFDCVSDYQTSKDNNYFYQTQKISSKKKELIRDNASN
jgi:hypothetical protein